MPGLSLEAKGASVEAKGENIMSAVQTSRAEEHGRAICSPDGYPTMIPNKEGMTKAIRTDPYYTGEIMHRSGVLGHGDRWFKHNEREAMWRTQKPNVLDDMRYVAAYSTPAQSQVSAYRNEPPSPKLPDSLKKKGSPFINGVSYVPKSVSLMEQPAVILFSNDPRVVTLDSVASDLRDPKHNTVANSLAYVSLSNRSKASVTAKDNYLVKSRKTYDNNQRFRLIQRQGQYGEGVLGMSWHCNCKSKQVNDPFAVPLDVAGHHQRIGTSGIVHSLKGAGMHDTKQQPSEYHVQEPVTHAVPHHASAGASRR
jgi:hypothetical protein